MQCQQSVTERIFAATVVSAVVALILRDTFAAPIRAYIPGIWYVADAAMLFSLAAFFFCGLSFRQTSDVFIVVTTIGLILISFCLLEPESAMFASRYLLSVCVGALAAHNGLHKSVSAKYGLAVLALVLSGSIMYDHWVGFEWPETRFESLLGTDSSIQRVWWRGEDDRRLPGFSLASTDAALYLACTLTILLYPRGTWKPQQSLLFCVLGFYALLLTKQFASTIVAGILVTAFALLHSLGFKVLQINQLAKTLAIVGLVLCPILPFALSGVDLVAHFGSTASSLNERTADVWPRAIDRALSVPTIIIGDGFGSVGQAAEYTSIKMIEVPDNAFLFLVIQFGTIALMLVLMAIYIVARADVSRQENGPCFAIVALLSFNGITANVGHNVVACLFLGYCLAYLARYPRLVDKLEYMNANNI